MNFHLLRGGLYGELRWQGFAEEVVGLIAANPRFKRHRVRDAAGVPGAVHESAGRLPAAAAGERHPALSTNRDEGTSAVTIDRDGLRHIAGTLSDAVNCAFCLGWRHIVLVGVDLYDSRYFYLPPDQTATVDRAACHRHRGAGERAGRQSVR